MKIRFTEDRILLDQSRVSAGEERDFPEDEARGFIANGVAEPVALSPEPRAQKKEVAANA